MALELESTIMNEIGLGRHYNYYNGSGCRYIRESASQKITDKINAHSDKRRTWETSPERVAEFESQIEQMKDPRVRRGFLDSFYAKLVHGEIQNLNPEAIEQVSNMMAKYGFEPHAQKLRSYEQEAPANIAPAYQPLIETLQKIASVESGAYRDFDSHWYRVAEDQDRVKEIGPEAARKEKQEREKNAWKPRGYWPSARDSVLTNTWEAASYVIAEHIHTAGLPEAERTERLENLRQSLELEYVTKERLFSQLTHFGNGTDGHQMRNLGKGIKYDARDEERLQGYMDVLKEMIPEHSGMMMRGMFGKEMLDF